MSVRKSESSTETPGALDVAPEAAAEPWQIDGTWHVEPVILGTWDTWDAPEE